MPRTLISCPVLNALDFVPWTSCPGLRCPGLWCPGLWCPELQVLYCLGSGFLLLAPMFSGIPTFKILFQFWFGVVLYCLGFCFFSRKGLIYEISKFKVLFSYRFDFVRHCFGYQGTGGTPQGIGGTPQGLVELPRAWWNSPGPRVSLCILVGRSVSGGGVTVPDRSGTALGRWVDPAHPRRMFSVADLAQQLKLQPCLHTL